MGSEQLLRQECDLFVAEQVDHSVVVRFRPNQLLLATSHRQTKALDDYLRLASSQDDVRAMVFMGPPGDTAVEEYVTFFSPSLQRGASEMPTKRLCAALDTFVTGVLRSEKIIITAVSGQVISDYLGAILACDHRVFGDDTVFVNAHLKLGLTPKGGAAYFLARQLGRSNAYQFLLEAEGVPVARAAELGLSGDVVPAAALEEHALGIARRFCEAPVDTVRGLKSLMNHALGGVGRYLDHENSVLDRIILSHAFPETR
jgi:enoyl-CoA hydratase/carnithine racemase